MLVQDAGIRDDADEPTIRIKIEKGLEKLAIHKHNQNFSNVSPLHRGILAFEPTYAATFKARGPEIGGQRMPG